MISYSIVTLLMIVSLFAVKKHGLLGFVLLIALIGSDTDSAGVLYAISAFIPGYKILIRGLILSLFIYSVISLLLQYLNGKIKRELFWFYLVPLFLLSIIIFTVNVFRNVGLIVALSEVIWLGVPVFFIWTFGSLKNKGSQNVFVKIVFYQSIITLIVLLLGPLTQEINGATYAYIIKGDHWRDLAQTIINASISFGNFSKQSLSTFKFAQFHNPNSLGVYSVTYMIVFLLIFLRKDKKFSEILVAVFLLIVGVIGWFNSLTRGPIFLVLLIFAAYFIGIIIRPRTRERVFFMLFISLLLIINSSLIIRLVQHFIVSSTNISVTSRLSGFSYAFNSISISPIWGVMPRPNDPIPHILPLKIGAYYGLPALVLITIPFMHVLYIGAKTFMRDLLFGISEKSLFSFMSVGIILGAYLTNGVIVYVLFWILLAESIDYFQKDDHLNELNRLEKPGD